MYTKIIKPVRREENNLDYWDRADRWNEEALFVAEMTP